jgi:hypothetical protein
MTVPVKRDGRGRLLPGASLNPGGRSSDLSAVRAELREHSPTAARALVALLDHPDPGTRLRAIEIFYDRLCGRPVQSVEQDLRTTNITQTIQQMYLAVVSGKAGGHGAPQTIEGEMTTTALPREPHGNDDTTTEW